MRILALFLMAMAASAQDDSWKTEIDNSLVHVSRLQIEPLGNVPAAEMPPALLVFLTDYGMRVTGVTPNEELRGAFGECHWHPGGQIGLENLSDHRLEVAQFVPKFGPALPPFTELEPSSALNRRNIEFENDLIRVAHTRVREGARLSERRDPTAVIHLTAAHVKFIYQNGPVEERRAKAGDIRWDEGGGFTFENLGDRLEALRIELKAGLRKRE